MGQELKRKADLLRKLELYKVSAKIIHIFYVIKYIKYMWHPLTKHDENSKNLKKTR